MLNIVETLKEYENILLGQIINVYTDHTNNISPTMKHQSKRLTRWRWLIDEFGPTFHYVEGQHNTAADALSRLTVEEPKHMNHACL